MVSLQFAYLACNQKKREFQECGSAGVHVYHMVPVGHIHARFDYPVIGFRISGKWQILSYQVVVYEDGRKVIVIPLAISCEFLIHILDKGEHKDDIEKNNQYLIDDFSKGSFKFLHRLQLIFENTIKTGNR
jgi:hypothetical protein